MRWWTYALIATSILSVVGAVFYTITGAGSFRRMVTISGIYTVCRPDHYEVVCFMDADSKQGGVFCMPLSQVGGECRK